MEGKRWRRQLGAWLLVLMSAPAVGSTVRIGDDDGMGGQFCSGNCNPGSDIGAIGGFTPVIGPGLYIGDAGTDARSDSTGTRSPGGYRFAFDFAFDTRGLAAITTAQVSVQVASLGRRQGSFFGDSGYGWANVVIDNDLSRTASGVDSALGSLLAVTTVPDSPSEEVVRLLTFDVRSFLAPGTQGLLHFLIDGSNEARRRDEGPDSVIAYDKFVLDFAELRYEGSPIAEPVPLPGAFWLLGSACGLCAGGLTRRRRPGHETPLTR